MNKIKIGIDLDEVLAEFNLLFLDYFNQTKNTNWKFKDITDNHFENIFDISFEEIKQILNNFSKEGHISNIIPVENSVSSIEKLSKECELFIITARPKEEDKETREWIVKNFKSNFKEIYSVGISHGGKVFKNKGEFVQELGLNFFIEDMIKHAIDISKRNIKVFLLDKPWNQEENLPENIYRVKDWNEILQKIEYLKSVI